MCIWFCILQELHASFVASILPNSQSDGGGDNMLCTICGKRLSSKQAMKAHVRIIHKGIYPFQCSQCERRFASKRDLTTHMRHHTGERLACEICQRKFIHKSSLIDHKANCAIKINPWHI